MNKQVSFIKYVKQAAFLLGCLFVLGCENDPKEIKALTERRLMVEEAKDIQSYLSQNGKMRARLVSPLMRRFSADTQYIEFPQTLHVDFYDSLGKIESQLNARYGKYFETLNKVYLRDHVVVANVKGDTLRSPDLWWDQNTQKFYTDKQVQIKRSGDRILGGMGMEASQDLSDILIRQPMGTVALPPDSASSAPDTTIRQPTLPPIDTLRIK